jgi:hypothetical protein
MLMLPRRLYELLPYLYIITSIVSALLIHSRLIIISSTLMFMAGVIILTMRFSSRSAPSRRRVFAEGGHIGAYSQAFIKRSARNRRRSAAARFPLIDRSGKVVACDRRFGDRRLSVA